LINDVENIGLEIFFGNKFLEIEIRSPGYKHDKYWKKGRNRCFL